MTLVFGLEAGGLTYHRQTSAMSARSFVSLALLASLASVADAAECGPGTYYWGVWSGQEYCVRCPAGTTSSGCKTCKPDPSRTSCFSNAGPVCARGKFLKTGACESCPSGKWQSGTGKTTCYACPSGMFQPTAGLHSCYWCPHGQYFAKTGAVRCDKCDTCAKGKYGITEEQGQKASTACKCKDCAAGQYTAAGYQTCFKCPTGRFQSAPAAYSCYFCQSGKFAAAPGSTACTSCPTGRASPNVGAIAADQCVSADCAIGQYSYLNPASKAKQCVPCSAGTFGTVVAGKSTCVSCAAGKHQPTTGQRICLACPKGQFQDTGGKSCSATVTYTANFMAYTYTYAAALKPKGWTLLTYQHAQQYRKVFAAHYIANGGLKMMGTWASSGCCLTVAGGYRLTANGKSFVYPYDAAGRPQCSANGSRFSAAERYRLAFMDGGKTLDISQAASLYAAGAAGATCGKKTGEQNPGLYMHLTPGARSDATCFTFDSLRLCVSTPVVTNAPTPAPPAPTPAPTRAPTADPTPAPTPPPTPKPTQPPIDCQVAAWREWGACSRSCGGGYQKRTRVVTVPSAYQGKPCPVLQDGRACGAAACPVDCNVGAWDAWSSCAVSCGGASQQRERSVLRAALHGGAACPATTATRPCGTAACPVDCLLSAWTAWTSCSATCGKGTKSQMRVAAAQPRFGGRACPEAGSALLNRAAACDAGACPVHCAVSDWQMWSKCSKTCGGGFQFRLRQVTRHAAHGGFACPLLTQAQKCNSEPCAVDCLQSAWEPWSSCSATCGGGVRARKRPTLRNTAHGGRACGAAEQREPCNAASCPIDCFLTPFGPWSSCSKTCGAGRQAQKRSVIVTAAYGGRACAVLSMSRDCGTAHCPRDCVVGDWASWGTCSTSCGAGEAHRYRSIATLPLHGGMGCPVLKQVRQCSTAACPVHCTVGAWASWEACTHSCGQGQHQRYRRILVEDKFGGTTCPALSQTAKCGLATCPVDCAMTQWSSFNVCSESCGVGVHQRTRAVRVAALNGGKPCPKDDREVRPCSSGPCPVHCATTAWRPWSACSKTCGTGTKKRTRSVTTHALHGGFQCPALVSSGLCATAPCPVDCEVSSFGPFGSCSHTCGGGTMQRRRIVAQMTEHGGKLCPALFEQSACSTQACPVDCAMNPWAAWGACSKSCGNGWKLRRRTVKVAASAGGVGCPVDSDQSACHVMPCPVDCQVRPWSAWTECDRSCAGGTQSRSRGIQRQAAYGGKLCPALLITQGCNGHTCPVDCVVSKWSPWNACSKSCLGGSQARTRTIATPPAMGGNQRGAPCPVLSQTQSCAEGPCPIDCLVSEFTTWSACSVTCGGGKQDRTRVVRTAHMHGGSVCPSLYEQRLCKQQACPVDCVVQAWSAWKPCSLTCGTGMRTRARVIYTKPQFGGKGCPPLDSSELCNTHFCPVNCVLSAWSAWESCSRTCGGGSRERRRSVSIAAIFGGRPCDSLSEKDACAIDACPVDCTVGAFGDWGACTVTCGGGTQMRGRRVVTATRDGGKACPSLSEQRRCMDTACPVDCQVSAWGLFTDCTKTCGGGSRTRMRSVDVAAAHGGKACAELSNTFKCNGAPCPINCDVSTWTQWGECSQSCGAGTRKRSRKITVYPSHGGTPCPTSLLDAALCNEGECPVHCVMAAWGGFAACTVSCGGGTKARKRAVHTSAAHGGFVCPHLVEEVSCRTAACPVDCVVNAWEAWSTCTATCGTGASQRTRGIKVGAAFGGKTCPALSETRDCNPLACAVDCVLGSFGPWTSCSTSCGGGTRTRARAVIRDAANGGKKCGLLTGRDACSTEPCAVDCQLSAWGSWSKCSATCDGGTKMRTRKVTREALFGGKECQHDTNMVTCNSHECPVDCAVSQWDDYDPCTKSCGAGTRKRMRSIVRLAAHGGVPCPGTVEVDVCNSQPCPVDCVVSAFDAWRECSHSCGNAGDKKRTRSITTINSNGGKACPPQVETLACNRFQCPQDCTVHEWGKWSACTKTCHDGKQTRTRAVNMAAVFGGAACGDLAQERACNEGPCPIHCVVSAFSAWTPCTRTCGRGSRTRTREVVTNNLHGGSVCPSLKQTEACATAPCPVDCQMSTFGAWSGSAGPQGAWSACSHSCGGGTSTRTRTVVRPASFGGIPCGHTQEARSCGTAACPVDCEMSNYGVFASCSRTCGGGSRSRFRSVNRASANGGKPCGALELVSTCNTETCPVDCAVSTWTEWSVCTMTCGSGTRSRSRTVEREAVAGGKGCPVLSSWEKCQTQSCPVDCRVGSYGFWGPCSASCDGGTKMRTRPVQIDAAFGGVECPSRGETMACGELPCPVNCVVSDWKDWTGCSKTCGIGINVRGRSIMRQAQHGGTPCPLLKEQHSCNARPCPVHCEQASWASWSACDRTCGGGTATRVRNTKVNSEFGGSACGSTNDSKKCNAFLCAEDCVVGAFGAFSQCSAPCNMGTMFATRAVARPAQYGGKVCPPLRDTKTCNHHCCTGYYGGNTLNGKVSTQCVACALGTYQAVSKTGEFVPQCTSCAAGRFQDKKAQAGCFECPAGQFSSPGSVRCTDHAPCPAGKYLSHLGASKTTAGVCVSCSAGTFKGRVPAHLASFNRACEAVLECPAGQLREGFSATSPGVCTACATGKFKEAAGTFTDKCSACATCRAGTFRNGCSLTSAGKCATCPFGKYKFAGIGGKAADQCTWLAACPAGSYRVATGATDSGTCRACAEGTFKIAGTDGSWKDKCSAHLRCPTGSAHSGTASSKGACTMCAAGQYVKSEAMGGAWNEKCAACAAGRYQPTSGHTSCISCLDGQWQDQAGGTSCSKCDAGRFGLGTSFATSSSQHCQDCPRGKFQIYAASSSCNICIGCSASGTYLAGCGDTAGGSCQKCAKGRFKAAKDSQYYWTAIQQSKDWEDGCTAHAACGAGYFRTAHDEHSSGKCTTCAAGQYKDSGKMEACATCAALTCPAGTYRLGCGGASKGRCVACGAGSFADAGNHNVCSSCPTGKFSGSAGASECAVCTAGRFQDEAGEGKCKGCGVGKYSNVEHANSPTVCTDCGTGTYQSLHGQAACTDCPAGTAQPSTGAPYLSHCAKCVQGTYASVGAAACTKCAAGKRGVGAGLDNENDACTFCSAGTFATAAGAPTCTACNKGTYGHHEGKHCVACTAGRFQSKDGSDKCVDCPANTYASTTSQHTCRSCTSLDKSATQQYWTNGVAGATSCVPKPVSCKLSAWSSFGACSASCGSGTRTQTRKALAPAFGGGMACSAFKLANTEACAAIPCAEDCQLEAWSAFGTCSKECGWGFEVRTRKIARLAKAGGRQCGSLSEQRACRLRDCGCSHTTCSYSRHAVLGVSRIEVHHHNKESFGSKHVCAFSQATQRCACECSGANGKRDKVAEAAFYAAKKKAAVVESNLL